MGNPDLPDAGGGACCIGAAVYGPQRCTCWEPVYDLEQQPPRTELEPVTRAKMCADCAFRPGSPERTGHARAGHDQEDVAALGVPGAGTFWCHQGVRLMVALVHPSGARVELPDRLAYDPPQVGDLAYQADGTPMERCAGQVAAQRAFARHA